MHEQLADDHLTKCGRRLCAQRRTVFRDANSRGTRHDIYDRAEHARPLSSPRSFSAKGDRVDISNSHQDYFTRNLLAIRAEEGI